MSVDTIGKIERLLSDVESAYGEYLTVAIDMTSATWNTVAVHEVLTVTGLVHLKFVIECTADLASVGAPTIQCGHETDTDLYVANTAFADIDVNELWYSATPSAEGATSSAIVDRVINGLDVGYEILVAALTGGSLLFHVYWKPLENEASVVAGAGGVM